MIYFVTLLCNITEVAGGYLYTYKHLILNIINALVKYIIIGRRI